MVRAPGYGGGYPFAGGRFEAKPGTRAARLLDPNQDGTVTVADDPGAPYWPGRRFTDLLPGHDDGAVDDERAVPDFYGRHGEGMGLPVAITETAACYNPGARTKVPFAKELPSWAKLADDAPTSC
ncbi:MAG: hypothetical protein JWP24_338 [Marmoricola sp.]|nr:hypothetical protein [Marmoricola sp.]